MALPERNRLIKKKEIDAVFREGKDLRGDFLFIKQVLNDLNQSRFVVSVPAKLYRKAIERNRIKRVLLQTIKDNLKNIIKNSDVIVVIRNKTNEENLKIELGKLLKRLSIL